MSRLARIPTQDFDRDVTAVAMDDRFILVGQVDGKLSAVYHKNGVSVFSAKISENEITAVCCEEQDEDDNPIFYAGDIEGNLYTVNKKGKVLATAKLQARKGKIHTIVNRNKYSIYAYTSGGNTSFSHATTDFRKGNFSTASANYSFDGDGTFHKKKGAGDYNVIQYDARTPSKIVATCAIEFGKKVKNFEQVFVYAVVDDEYENLIEEGTAENAIIVFNDSSKKIRTLEFKSPVKQVMSCRHHEGDAETDKIYILLWNGMLYKCTGAMLMDPEVANGALDLKVAVMEEDDEDEDDDKGEYKGFCVFGKKICIYGNDGLFTADVKDD
eukprot:GFUD01085540.1.p1 GENE.GFUD01085540.1~~GFUD01085540.1.p1  ORF type:complete len:327 (-),score=109.76 GFUD01085540.1:125-1105(-)